MREIIRMVHGSYLYGTNLETSDRDYKAVYIPDAQDILLQRVRASIYNGNTEERNQPGQEDINSTSLQQFLKLLCQGQTMALDMIFTPEKYWVTAPDPEWLIILSLRDKFLSRNVQAFVGYCRGQARKYSVRIQRFQAIENAHRYFNSALEVDEKPVSTKVSELGHLKDFLANNFDSRIENIELQNGKVIPHVSICDVRVPVTATIKEAYNIYSRKFHDYGERIARASEMGANDWKSTMHAIRVADEAVEFLTTGEIVFPRPNADFLLSIRKGEIPYSEVSERIEQGLARVEEALQVSTLPSAPDWELADQLVEKIYRAAVLEGKYYK